MATNGLNLQTSGLTFTTGAEKRMLIDNLGQFGFGTMSPSTDFHVVGTGATTGVRFEGLPSSSTNTNFMVVDSNGVIQTRSDIAVGTVITAVTESNNVITVEDNQGASSTLTIDALTGVSYDSSWGITNAGTGTVSANFELPFITGSSLSNGSLSFGVNGGLETISSVSGFSIDIAGDDDSSTVNLGGTITIAGGTALTSVQDAGTVTINLDNTLVTPGEYGSSSETVTFTVDQQGRLTAASEQSINITASQISDFATSAETAVFQSGNFTDTTGASGIDFTVVAGDSVSATLVNSSTTFAGTTGTSPEVDLGGTLSFISSDGSVVVSGNTDTFDLTVSAGVDTFITGGTYTDNTGTLTLTDNDNTTITIDGKWNHLASASIASNVIEFTSNTGGTSNVTVAAVTGGTFDASTGNITVAGSGSLSNISLGTNFVTGVTEVDNVVTITKNGGASSNFTIQAVTGITYNNDWDIAFVGSGSLGTTPFELPFITGGTYNAGTVTLGINGGLESNITITGLTSTNIYDADGTLTGVRTVTQAGNKLSFTGGDFSVDGTTFNVDDSGNSVGIGTATPAASAVLEVASTTKGFLFPRMTESQRTGIGSLVTGLMVYQTDGDEGVYIYKSFGWVQVI